MTCAESLVPHNLHIAIENWLTRTNRHILKAAKLVLAYQIHEAALSRTKIFYEWRPRKLEG